MSDESEEKAENHTAPGAVGAIQVEGALEERPPTAYEPLPPEVEQLREVEASIAAAGGSENGGETGRVSEEYLAAMTNVQPLNPPEGAYVPSHGIHEASIYNAVDWDAGEVKVELVEPEWLSSMTDAEKNDFAIWLLEHPRNIHLGSAQWTRGLSLEEKGAIYEAYLQQVAVEGTLEKSRPRKGQTPEQKVEAAENAKARRALYAANPEDWMPATWAGAPRIHIAKLSRRGAVTACGLVTSRKARRSNGQVTCGHCQHFIRLVRAEHGVHASLPSGNPRVGRPKTRKEKREFREAQKEERAKKLRAAIDDYLAYSDKYVHVRSKGGRIHLQKQSKDETICGCWHDPTVGQVTRDVTCKKCLKFLAAAQDREEDLIDDEEDFEPPARPREKPVEGQQMLVFYSLKSSFERLDKLKKELNGMVKQLPKSKFSQVALEYLAGVAVRLSIALSEIGELEKKS